MSNEISTQRYLIFFFVLGTIFFLRLHFHHRGFLNCCMLDSTSFVYEAGSLWVRSRRVRIVRRKWTSRECLQTRILLLNVMWTQTCSVNISYEEQLCKTNVSVNLKRRYDEDTVETVIIILLLWMFTVGPAYLFDLNRFTSTSD